MPTPIRGTQSFVAVMAGVWGRPSLMALEIMWRWLPAVFILAFVLIIERTFGIGMFPPNGTSGAFQALQSISVFQPSVAVDTVRAAVASIFPHPLLALRGFLVLILIWNLIAAIGRTIVLRRFDTSLHARSLTIFLLGTLRTLFLMGAWALWLWIVAVAAGVSITSPAAHGEEPSLVLFAAIVICSTLTLYCLWAVFSWFLQLAPLLAMQQDLGPLAALRKAILRGPVRGKLIEINLVMNIVKLALIVLAMVFSASPLPFTSVATPEFLRLWWAGVLLLYFAMSDYFHVVRAAAYLSLWRVYHPADLH